MHPALAKALATAKPIPRKHVSLIYLLNRDEGLISPDAAPVTKATPGKSVLDAIPLELLGVKAVCFLSEQIGFLYCCHRSVIAG